MSRISGNVREMNQNNILNDSTGTGPIFNRRVEITRVNRVLRDEHWFLENAECRLMPGREQP